MTEEQEPIETDRQTQCLIPGCKDETFSGGLCSTHGLQKYYREVGSGLDLDLVANPLPSTGPPGT
jgi:hypothetical protein